MTKEGKIFRGKENFGGVRTLKKSFVEIVQLVLFVICLPCPRVIKLYTNCSNVNTYCFYC